MTADTLEMTAPVLAKLRAELPEVAKASAGAVIAEVPGYREMRGPAGAPLDQAVELALRGFLSAAAGSTSRTREVASPLQPALDGAYELGRGEVRSGRTMDVLLGAYRVGARAAWREWSRVATGAGITPDQLARFAELTFTYIDELSAASVSGYSDELARRDSARQRSLERLSRRLLAGDPIETLEAEAERAGWQPPKSLSAGVLPSSRGQGVRSLIDARSLQLADDLPGTETNDDVLVLLVPTIDEADRVKLKRALAGREAILGPQRVWTEARLSFRRALQVHNLGLGTGRDEAIEADDHLVDLVIGSDPEALSDLRSQVLAPMESLRPTAAAKLTETLRAWLLHQGRREDIAAALFIHPQTVRYRMGQIREIYGDLLDDPETVLAATVALGIGSDPRDSKPEPRR